MLTLSKNWNTMKAKIIEDRGYGIRYEVFTGTIDECFDTLDFIENEIAAGERRNGNNDPYLYDVVPEDWDIKDAFTEASSMLDWDNM
jgi:hypothetical protein